MLKRLWKWYKTAVCGEHICEEFTQWEQYRIRFTIVRDNGSTYPEDRHYEQRQCVLLEEIEDE